MHTKFTKAKANVLALKSNFSLSKPFKSQALNAFVLLAKRRNLKAILNLNTTQLTKIHQAKL